jgi:hypothetical protein
MAKKKRSGKVVPDRPADRSSRHDRTLSPRESGARYPHAGWSTPLSTPSRPSPHCSTMNEPRSDRRDRFGIHPPEQERPRLSLILTASRREDGAPLDRRPSDRAE